MGQNLSTTAAAAAGSAVERSPPNVDDRELLQQVNLNVHPPSAVVIGASMAGLQIARDLAVGGFVVDVVDAQTSVGGREAHCSIPVVGYVPRPFWMDFSVRRALLQGLFPNSQPMVLSREHSLSHIISPRVHQWLWGRFCCTSTPESTAKASRQLASQSVAVVDEMVRAHPELAKHVTASSTGFIRDDSNAASATRQLWMDTLGWSNELATICQNQLGVTFRLGERVVMLSGDFRGDIESIDHVFLKNVQTGENLKLQYDVVVVAAGIATRALVGDFMTLPLVPFSGFRIDCPREPSIADSGSDSGSVGRELLKAVCSSDHEFATACSTPWGKTVSANGVLLLKNPASAVSLVGLHCFNTTYSPKLTSHDYILRTIASQMRINGLFDWGAKIAELLESTTSKTTLASRFVRSAAPDGLPIASVCGNTHNGFVCAGFAGNAATFSPGAARAVSSLVLKNPVPSSDAVPIGQLRLGMFKRLPSLGEPHFSFTQKLGDVENFVYETPRPLAGKMRALLLELALADDLLPIWIKNKILTNFDKRNRID